MPTNVMEDGTNLTNLFLAHHHQSDSKTTRGVAK